jgi:hypothetical protein
MIIARTKSVFLGAVVICLSLAVLAQRSNETVSCVISSTKKSSEDCLVENEINLVELTATTSARSEHSISFNVASNKVNGPLINLSFQKPHEDSWPVRIDFAQKLFDGAYQVTFDLGKSSLNKIEVEIRENRIIRVWINKEKVYGFEWNAELTAYEPAAKYSLSNSGDTISSVISVQLLNTVESKLDFLNWLLPLLLMIAGLFWLGPEPRVEATGEVEFSEVKDSYKKILSISVVITFLTLLAGRFNLYGSHPYFDRNGITLAHAARFSDWFQIRELSTFAEPYLVGGSNYPPLFLAVFRIFGLLATELGLRMVAVFLVLVLSKILCTVISDNSGALRVICFVGVCISYPFLFAFDRGGTDLLVAIFFSLFCLLLLKERFTSAALILGFIIGMKVFPLIFLPLLSRSGSRFRAPLIAVGSASILTMGGSLVLSGSPLRSLFEFLSADQSVSELIAKNQNLASRGTSIVSWAYNLKEFRVPEQASTALPELSAQLSWMIAIVIVSTVLWVIVSFKVQIETRLFLLTLVLLLISPLSNDYRLLYLIPVLSFWFPRITSTTNTTAVVWITGLLVSARPLQYATDTSFTLGGVFTAPLLLALLVIAVSEIVNGEENERIISTISPSLHDQKAWNGLRRIRQQKLPKL